jgi:GxxExxY protein
MSTEERTADARRYPPIDADREELDRLTKRVIGCAFTVAGALGAGFIERVYENALAHELRKAGLSIEQQRPINVYYDGVLVGEYVADLLVDEQVLIELKAARALDEAHRAQCLNYLKATGLKVCLLINFGAPRLQVRRLVNNF